MDASMLQPGWWEVANLVGLATLIAITIFRREISCNHVYAEQPPPTSAGTTATSNSSVTTTTSGESRGAIYSSTNSTNNSTTTTILSIPPTTVFIASLLRLLQWMLPHNSEVVCKVWKSLVSWWDAASEFQRLDALLDGVQSWPQLLSRCPPSDIIVTSTTSSDSNRDCTTSIFPAANEQLPIDTLVHIASFLHPKDVITLGSVNRQTSDCVGSTATTNSTSRNPPTAVSEILWKMLFFRDYGWILHEWSIGRQALQRSLETLRQQEPDPLILTTTTDDLIFDRDVYFRFSLCYLDYLLAGHYSSACCLVGLGGNMYDMTHFLDHHPGSPETVMVHAGSDASDTFASVRHTVRARERAQDQCIIVHAAASPHNDSSSSGGGDTWCGLRPTRHFAESGGALPPLVDPRSPHLERRRQQQGPASTVQAFGAERIRMASYYQRHAPSDALDAVHTYWDPFCKAWKAWYIRSTDGEAVFLDDTRHRQSSRLRFR